MGETNGNFLKYSTLMLITIQTSTMVLLLRYSRRQMPNIDDAYINSTAIFLSEFIKLFICIFVIISSDSIGGLIGIFRSEIIGRPREFGKIFIPAILYLIQNNLLFLALTNLDAATYQVTYQFKILTTAIFSVTLLRKRLSGRQWAALFSLMIGVILVQWPNNQANEQSSQSTNESANADIDHRMIGFFAVVISSFSSGFCGVYFEKLIKHSNQTLWTRNIQLAIVSCLFSFANIYLYDFDLVQIKGFFHGYNSITWSVILLQAFGGICVSLVMKYADNILKGFATTISIILSSICSYFVFADFVPNTLFFAGTTLVISSTMLYAM